jgi:hypothetical protein
MTNLGKALALLGLAATSITIGCREDMQDQPRLNPLAKSSFYSDQRSERPPVEGTVARGQLHEDAYLYTGKIDGNLGDTMPFPVTRAVLDRGHERFNIFCAPCHSRVGDGEGFIPSRGFARKPPSFHIARLQKEPVGYFYDVITNGFGIMPDYAAQIPVSDRWSIVAYIRALQLSQHASAADVPSGHAMPSAPPRYKDIGTGATPPVEAPEVNSKSEDPKSEEQK